MLSQVSACRFDLGCSLALVASPQNLASSLRSESALKPSNPGTSAQTG